VAPLWVVPLALLALWLVAEVAVRAVLELPLRVDFYGSVSRDDVRDLQAAHGVRLAAGPGWLHLGWIADPERESYRIERRTGDAWRSVGRATYGSFLSRDAGGSFRVWALPRRSGKPERLLGEASGESTPGGVTTAPLHRPEIAGAWRPLFRPRRHGRYVNDHAVYRDAAGRWRLLGITSQSAGDFGAERYFASAVSETFPPADGMREEAPVADFGELAWAPEVVEPGADGGGYALFWSPHRLSRMDSPDGVQWTDPRVVMEAPVHRFFRDPAILEVAEGQWLLYATARGRYFSRIDAYQSFDLERWQYIGAALDSSWGSERNSPFASMESPVVVRRAGRHDLSFTYNNGSFFWPGLLLLLRVWPGRRSYEETLVVHADNPYDFGTYRGRTRTPSLVARLRTHAPAYVHHPETDAWFITTAGWPWAATLTDGDVAVAPLRWVPVT
jgi:hypothetical protein